MQQFLLFNTEMANEVLAWQGSHATPPCVPAIIPSIYLRRNFQILYTRLTMAAKKKTSPQTQNTEHVQPVAFRPEPEKELFTWRAKSRPFKKRTKEFWVSVIAIASVISFILFLIEGPISVILVISIVFLTYILSSVEPDMIEYSITNRNIKIAGQRTNIGIVMRYWFSKRFNETLLVFETTGFPGRLELVVNEKDKEKIREALAPYLVEEEATPSRLEKSAEWLSNKLPNE